MVQFRKDKDDRFRQSIYIYTYCLGYWSCSYVVCFIVVYCLPRDNFSIWRPLLLKGFVFRPILGGLAIEQWAFISTQDLLGAVTWLKYCRYGVKLYPINPSINQSNNWDTWLRSSWFHQNDSWHSRLLSSDSQWNCHNLFSRIRFVATEIWPRSLACEAIV